VSLSLSNKPSSIKINRPIDRLVHRHGLGKKISNEKIKEIADRKYQINREGITYLDIIKEFGCSKTKAQRKLKNLCVATIDDKGKKASVLFRAFKRTNPQQFYLSSKRAKIIEDLNNNKNRLKDPTGVNHHSHPFLAKRDQSARYFLEILYQFLHVPIFLHKLFLQTFIDPAYYKELKDVEKIVQVNKAIQYEEIIGPLPIKRKVTFTINPNGTVMIYITCSRNPFKLENGEDISYIFSFLGQVRDRLLYFLKDPNERILPSLMEWKLNQCDINKDIEINDKEQITLPDIQLIEVDKVFRLYVRAMEQRAYYRFEESKKVNQKLSLAFDCLLKTYYPLNEFDDSNPSYIQ
jgi:hypothetical protein